MKDISRFSKSDSFLIPRKSSLVACLMKPKGSQWRASVTVSTCTLMCRNRNNGLGPSATPFARLGDTLPSTCISAINSNVDLGWRSCPHFSTPYEGSLASWSQVRQSQRQSEPRWDAKIDSFGPSPIKYATVPVKTIMFPVGSVHNTPCSKFSVTSSTMASAISKHDTPLAAQMKRRLDSCMLSFRGTLAK